MKLFIDARWVRTDYHDGISRYSTGIIEGFKSNNTPFKVLIKNQQQLKMLPEGVDYLLVNDPLSIQELFLSKKLNKLGAEMVYSPFQIFGSFGRKFKLIVTLHDIIYYLHPQAPTNLNLSARIVWRLFHMAKWPQRLLLNRADKLATVSEYSRRGITNLKLTNREIIVAYNASSLDLKEEDVSAPRTKNVIYMGSFMPYKNVEALILGMQYLPKDFTLHSLSKISDERKAILQKLIQPGVNVIFHNGVDDKEYVDLIKSAYCLATASKEEGFGLPLVEAQSLGTPVIVSDIEIFHEVAGDAALYFNPDSPKDFADCVNTLSDENTRQRLSDNGRQQSKKFTWSNSAKIILDAFEKI